MRKMLGLCIFIATGVGMMLISIFEAAGTMEILGLIIIAILFGIGLTGHYKEIRG